jgi:hypothetical protein
MEYITLKKCSELTGIDPANLRQRIKRKTIPANAVVKAGRDWFIKKQ